MTAAHTLLPWRQEYRESLPVFSTGGQTYSGIVSQGFPSYKPLEQPHAEKQGGNGMTILKELSCLL